MFRAEIAVHGLPDVIIIREGEGHAADAGDGRDNLHGNSGSGHHVENAGANLREHGRVRAELRVRKKLDVDTAARLFANFGTSFFHGDRGGVRRLKLAADFQADLGALRGQTAHTPAGFRWRPRPIVVD